MEIKTCYFNLSSMLYTCISISTSIVVTARQTSSNSFFSLQKIIWQNSSSRQQAFSWLGPGESRSKLGFTLDFCLIYCLFEMYGTNWAMFKIILDRQLGHFGKYRNHQVKSIVIRKSQVCCWMLETCLKGSNYITKGKCICLCRYPRPVADRCHSRKRTHHSSSKWLHFSRPGLLLHWRCLCRMMLMMLGQISEKLLCCDLLESGFLLLLCCINHNAMIFMIWLQKKLAMGWVPNCTETEWVILA